ncbi:battenin-like isoform X2 [Liolophura sinensis]|uniref:battenin-like isoform X2 n=1 Tax=Liolophura sinensis TaxID=3198878 RepID=UPI0031591C26
MPELADETYRPTLNLRFAMASKRNWLGLFLMGAINNLPYVIVNSAASSIASSFGVRNFVGLVFGANVSLSVFVKCLNTFLLLNVSYRIRFLVNGCLMLIGLFGVAYATSFGFAIGCIVIVGSSSAFGENVTLGYLHKFPSKLVNAWSSGTGMAGVLGSSLFIIFDCSVGTESGDEQQLRRLNKMAFLLTTPVVLIYWLAYFVVIHEPGYSPDLFSRTNINVQHAQVEDSEDAPLLAGQIPTNDSEVIEESRCHRYIRCLKLILWLALNAGVFVSRSSVQLVQIRRVDVLSALQLINMVVWITDVHYKFIPVYLLPALMIYVGLLGGASYVNIFYLLLNEEKYPPRDRELCVNLAALFVTLGIALGTGLETLLFTTVLKSD